MLFLTRSVGDKLNIGGDVTVTVLGFKGKQMLIGVDAPRDVQIEREERLSRESMELQFEYRLVG